MSKLYEKIGDYFYEVPYYPFGGKWYDILLGPLMVILGILAVMAICGLLVLILDPTAWDTMISHLNAL